MFSLVTGAGAAVAKEDRIAGLEYKQRSRVFAALQTVHPRQYLFPQVHQLFVVVEVRHADYYGVPSYLFGIGPQVRL